MLADWLGQKVGIYGYGRTGRALHEFLEPMLLDLVVLLDKASEEQLSVIHEESQGKVTVVTGDNIGQAIGRLDSLVLSPGVPYNNPNCQLATARGIPVVSELELASRYCQGYIIAITGTNGKSTTTKMLGHVLSALGPTHVLGNIGTPLVASLDQINPGDFVALEVSSYQLEAIEQFAPQIAIFTNLTPDHLDRHKTLDAYARVKRNMARNMDSSGFVIANALADAFQPEQFSNRQPVFLQFRSTPGNRLRGAWVGNGNINVDLGNECCEIPLDCINLPGIHNVENAMAVVLCAFLVGASPEVIAAKLSSFTGYEHRLEPCGKKGGVEYFNDSKATNPEATITALKAIEKPLALILGGRDKMTDLTGLCEWVSRKATGVVTYGEAAGRIEESLAKISYNNVSRADGMEQAVGLATAALKVGGGKVLLSPACASFDLYSSFEARGEHFKEIVSRLTK